MVRRSDTRDFDATFAVNAFGAVAVPLEKR